MASATIPAPHSTEVRAASTRIPWHLWLLVAAVCTVNIGGQIDVSWHRSIGRDSFWTLPHMMVYASGLMAGVSCSWLILATTFGRRPDLEAASVSLFGLRAPLGILLSAWGGLMMLYSAPVDNWWHSAYGLDVRVASPPHMLLLAGTAALTLGSLLYAAAHLHRSRLSGAGNENFERLFLFVGGVAVITMMSYSMGYTFDTHLHSWKPYFVMSAGVPFALAAIATTSRRRWSATIVAAIYTGFMLLMVWALPLFPATPHIGPVYQHVTQMIPPKFPLLLLAPAVALDFLWQRLPQRNPWTAAPASGLLWLACLVAAEWPFATFLMSPHAANRFFATRFVDFGTPPDNADVLRIFENPQHGLPLIAGLLAAAVVASIGLRIGKIFGEWMCSVYR